MLYPLFKGAFCFYVGQSVVSDGLKKHVNIHKEKTNTHPAHQSDRSKS